MKCVQCSRPLNKPAFSMPSKNGLLYWGPVCGARLVRAKRLADKAAQLPSQKTSTKRSYRDGLTRDLFEATQ